MRKLSFLLAIVVSASALALDEKEFKARYAGKYLVAIKDGLAVGICSGHRGGETGMRVDLDYSNARVHQSRAFEILDPDECRGASPEPIHVGEVLKIRHLAIHRGNIRVFVENVSPHAITRGRGAFQHESYEGGRAILAIHAPDDQTAAGILDHWVKPFSTAEEAAKYGNTASGAFVKEVKLGMTPAEVEQALGLPQTRVELGEKVLYKYKDMTVEFHEGKVTDVR